MAGIPICHVEPTIYCDWDNPILGPTVPKMVMPANRRSCLLLPHNACNHISMLGLKLNHIRGDVNFVVRGGTWGCHEDKGTTLGAASDNKLGISPWHLWVFNIPQSVLIFLIFFSDSDGVTSDIGVPSTYLVNKFVFEKTVWEDNFYQGSVCWAEIAIYSMLVWHCGLYLVVPKFFQDTWGIFGFSIIFNIEMTQVSEILPLWRQGLLGFA